MLQQAASFLEINVLDILSASSFDGAVIYNMCIINIILIVFRYSLVSCYLYKVKLYD